MNQAQETHVKSIARHIEEKAASIVTGMKALQRNSLASLPLDIPDAKFHDVSIRLQEIKIILDEMAKKMPVDKIRES